MQNIDSDVPHVKHEKKLNIEEANKCQKLLEEKANFNTSCHDILISETGNFQLKVIEEGNEHEINIKGEAIKEDTVSVHPQNDWAAIEVSNDSKLDVSKDVESSEDEEYVFVEEAFKEVNKPFQVTSF